MPGISEGARLVRLRLVYGPPDSGKLRLALLGSESNRALDGKNVQADRTWCLEQLQERIKAIDWKQAREDVRRFVKSNELPSLDLWSAEFFLAQAAKLV